MTLAETQFEVGHVSPVACPACIGVPSAVQIAADRLAAVPARMMLSLPMAHCAACITTVEQALMAVPGDVDVLIAAELMEAGRAVQRGLVTPERTTVIASSHRVYSVMEKTVPGSGLADQNDGKGGAVSDVVAGG